MKLSTLIRAPILRAAATLAGAMVALPLAFASGFSLTLTDPDGDDNGPGAYKYPTNPEYKSKSFDLRKLEMVDKGDDVEFRVTLGSAIEDPWESKGWPDGGGNGWPRRIGQ